MGWGKLVRKIRKLYRNLPYYFPVLYLRFFKKDEDEGTFQADTYLLPKESEVAKNNNIHRFDLQRFVAHYLKHGKNILHSVRFPNLPSKKVIRPILAGFLIIIIILQILVPGPQDKIYGATYTFTQTNWTEADTSVALANTNYPAHADGQTGWTKYFSKDAAMVVESQSLKLSSSTQSITETSAADFNAGTKSNTFVSSTGNSVFLLKPLGATCAVHSQCATGICEYGVCAAPPCNYETSVSYGGQSYDLVEVGTQCWMKQNISVGTLLNGPGLSYPSNSTTIERWCYGNNLVNNGAGGCDTGSAQGLGGLYTWSEAMQFDPACNSAVCSFSGNRQGICPSGYHIPTDNEYRTLEEYLGMCSGSTVGCSGSTAWRGTDQGTRLKLGGLSGLDFLLAGSGSFTLYNSRGFYWLTTDAGGSGLYAYMRGLDSSAAGVYRADANKGDGMSVRCVRDRGLAAGATCSADSQCATGYCPAGSPRVCKVPTGSSCTQDSECSSGLCYNNYCRAADGAACTNTMDCRPGTGSVCSGSVCKAPLGTTCATASLADTSCISNWCGSGNTCALKPDDTACGAASECISGMCSTVCVRKNEGVACSSHEQCYSGYCNSVCKACGGIASIDYSNVNYNLVDINNQCWFGKNLNVGTRLASASNVPTLGNGIVEKWCINDSDANCTAFGGLYNWPEALQLGAGCDINTCSPPTPAQGICPPGFHVPSKGEWGSLFTSLTDVGGTCNLAATGWQCTGAMPKLKTGGASGMGLANTGERNTNGTYFQDYYGFMWSSTQGDSAVYGWGFDYLVNGTELYIGSHTKSLGYSVRCIANSGARGNGVVCSSNSQCIVGNCLNGICVPVGACTQDGDCGTGGCYNFTCASRAIGNPCDSNPDCTYSNCYLGTCGAIGATCSAHSHCSSGACTGGVCVTPQPSISLSPASLSFTAPPNSAPANQTFIITNSGTGNLTWSVFNNNTAVCTLSATSGTISAGQSQTITVSVASQAWGGSYPCNIEISDANANNSPQTLSVAYIVQTGAASCGNGILETGEECDAGPSGGVHMSCSSYFNPSYSGNVICTASCTVDTSACSGSGSCPYLYNWNGNKFEFLTDLYGSGGLAYKRGANTLVPMPHRIYQIDKVVPKDGKIEFKIAEDLDEIDYFDRLQLLSYVVPETETFGLNIPPFEPAGVGKPLVIHTIGRELIKPVSAVRLDTNENVKDMISDVDDERMIFSPDPNYFVPTTFEIDFGDISNYPQKKLVITGESVFPKSAEGIERRKLYPKGQWIEVQDSNGEWVAVPDSKFLFSKPTSFEGRQALDISNIFISSSTKMRITYVYKTYINQVAFDGSDDLELGEPTLIPIDSAELHDSGVWHQYEEDGGIPDYYSTTDNSTYPRYVGGYTKFGDIKPLLETQDDKFVIMSRGDEITVKFDYPTDPVPAGYKRLYILDTWGYYKSVVSTVPRQVEPYPFAAMSNFPYATGTWPYASSTDYQDYLNTWNTRYCDGINNQCTGPGAVHPGVQASSGGLFSSLVEGVINTYESIVTGVRELISKTKEVIVAGVFDLLTIPTAHAASTNTGTFTSQVKDLTNKVLFKTLSWSATLETGTTITMEVRAGNTATPDGTWTSWYSVTNGGTINSALTGNRYVQYRATLSSTESDNYVPTLNDVTINYAIYSLTGTLVSSPYDSGDPANVMGSLSWDQDALPSGTTVTVELRTANNVEMNNPTAWISPTSCDDSASPLITCGNTTLPAAFKQDNDDRYFQYRITFTSDGSATPVVSEIRVQYVVNAPPEIQNVTAEQNADGTVSISYQARSSDTVNDTNSVGYLTPSFQYCVNGGATCSTLSTFSGSATSPQAVNLDGTSWTTFSATWRPAADAPGVWDQTAVIKVIVDDLQAANNIASSTSPTFTLDTIAPSNASFRIDATSTPATLLFTATDTSTPVTMRYATSLAALNAAPWGDFASSATLSLTDPSTVYAQFKDNRNNTSSIFTVVTPQTPIGFMIQDTSNLKITPNELRLFLAWKVVDAPSQGNFGGYRIYRSTSGSGPWTLLYTETSRTRNYYADGPIASANTQYFYKVVSSDNYGDTSFNSTVLNAQADGIQNLGEGGGGTAQAPTISNVATSSISGTSALISWDTDSLSNSTVSYSTTPGSFTSSVTVSSMADNASGIGRHEVLLSGLSPNTTYYFQVASANSDGQLSTDNNGGDGYEFTTTGGPVISLVNATDIGNTQATISWTTDISANSAVYYSTSTSFAAASSATDNSNVTSHSVTIPSLEAGTKYYYYVRSTGGGGYSDDKNIVNGTVMYYSFSTTNDTAAPTFSNFSSTPATSSAVLTFQTSKDGDTIIDYGTTISFGSSTALDGTMTKVHKATLTNLNPNTPYYWRARSSDANGNEGTSANQSFTTLELADTNPPIITNLATSSISLNSATVSWNTDKTTNGTVNLGTEPGNLEGNIFADVNTVTTSHSVTLSNLLGNTLYYFRVNSTDRYGNSASSTGSFTTVADQTPPVVSATSTLANNTAAFVNWRTDELAYGRVNYALDLSTLISNPTTVEVTSTPYLSQSMPLTGLTPSTTYYYNIIAWDISANTSTIGPYDFMTPVGAQTIVIDNTRPSIVIDNTRPPDTALPNITNLKVTDITPFTATISWTTDKESSSLVKYGQTMNYGGLAGDFMTFSTTHSVSLSDLTPGTKYNLSAASIDKVGNIGTSPSQTFVTLNVDGTVAIPSETTEDENKNENAVVAEVKKASQRLISQILNALLENPYLQNVPQNVLEATISELGSRVVNAPNIVGLRPQVEVHGNSATVRWSTDKKTTGLVSFAKESEYIAGAERPYTTSIVDSDNLSTIHTVELPSLEPATRYHFQVASKGEIGPEARSKDYTFETEAVKPEVSDAKVTDVKATEATVSWKTNVPTESTLEFTNLDTKKALTSGDPALLISHVFTLKYLDPGSKYTLVIKARNESGQESASNPLAFETIIDKEPPKVQNVSANSTLYPGATAKVQTIISWDTDEMAQSQLFYQEGVANTDNIKSLPLETTQSNKHFIVLTAFKPGTVYKYWIESTDPSGNKGKSESFTTLTPTEKQTIIDIISNNFQSVFGWTKNMGL